jgi:hypothetical protein
VVWDDASQVEVYHIGERSARIFADNLLIRPRALKELFMFKCPGLNRVDFHCPKLGIYSSLLPGPIMVNP